MHAGLERQVDEFGPSFAAGIAVQHAQSQRGALAFDPDLGLPSTARYERASRTSSCPATAVALRPHPGPKRPRRGSSGIPRRIPGAQGTNPPSAERARHLVISPGQNIQDIRLRDRILAGEPAAAESLLAQHLDPLYRFVRWRLGNDVHGVEDLVQDTFVSALEKMQTFDGRSSLHTWLCAIAKNKIRSKRRAGAPRSIEDVLEESDSEIDEILAEISREPLPDQVLDRKETRDLVGATLSSLPPEYADALVKKYVEGRSVAEIAISRGKGEKAIESVLTRARVAFARVFELLAKKRGGLT